MQLLGSSNTAVISMLMDLGGALGIFNCSFNWILYGIVNSTYRKAFKRLLCSGNYCGCSADKIEVSMD